MSQIPAFLRSLSALVRELGSSGRAVHVTAKTADELDLLAGLAWESMSIGTVAGTTQQVRLDENGRATPVVTPADISLGWLRASRGLWFPTPVTYPAECIHVSRAEILRAAECAELALLAQIPELPLRRAGDPYSGTIEGARAAWSFVVRSLVAIEVLEARGWRVALLDAYRRELEAMK